MLVNLAHLSGTAKVDYKFYVANELRERNDNAWLAIFHFTFQHMELFPRFFVYLKVELLLAADLIKFEQFFLVHAKFEFLK